ncbi:MAG TPA: enoyl-CoA hydratase/isomerase family protein, partial [Streptosporangiaceae bacterium]|nr:enoyl-CoA hydratase/isomerase family protein [Streptosporangiaceae bacterium]
MTTAPVPADVLERAGLPAEQSAAWLALAPDPRASFGAASDAVSRFVTAGQGLLARLPGRGVRSPAEQEAHDAVANRLDAARESFLREHAAALYRALTGNLSRSLRLEEILVEAAAHVPGLVPTASEMAAERARKLPDKEGIEFAHGLLFGHLLAAPEAGRHLLQAMLRPTAEAQERLGELAASDCVDLGPVRVTRQGRAGILEIINPRHLNAEDDVTLGPTEVAVDMILLDPRIEVGVIRGAEVDHSRFPKMRVFGSGLNLTRLYNGQIDYLFFLLRDIGYVNKIYRGLALSARDPGSPVTAANPDEGSVEKLWIAAVERFAVGGACQLLHVVDHVIATRGSRLFLPARNEGIIPGASNLRLPRFVGDRAARQAILSGREWIAGEPDAAMLCDEVVEPGDLDAAVAARVDKLTSSGLVNAAANRCTLRAGQEPIDLFREYMSAFAVEQAR